MSIRHRTSIRLLIGLAASAALLIAGATIGRAQDRPLWKSHDPSRPKPRVVTPAAVDRPGGPPSDAIVLFDGTGLDAWRGEEGGVAPWHLKDGVMLPVGKGLDLYTKRTFGDVQLHIEWSSPLPARGTGQGRGNSGVYFMGLYEVQVLDSFESETYADGQAAAIYGQYPPLVNACRAPGEWQAYDIVFRRPRFMPDGTLKTPARITVFHNNVLVQDAAAMLGPSMWLQHLPYEEHPRKLPLVLQDHGNPVRFRNIWVRELREHPEPGPGMDDPTPVMAMTPDQLKRYVGTYKHRPDARWPYVVESNGKQLFCTFGKERGRVGLVPETPVKFNMKWTAAHVEFTLPEEGSASDMSFCVSGGRFTLKRVD